MLTKMVRHVLGAPYRVPGYTRLVRRLRSRRLAVVMYHGVTAEPLPVFNWCQVAAADFAEQAALLAREYTVLHLSEIIDRLERRAPLPERAASLTFDDGFRNVLTTAYPILERYQLPATVFVVTGELATHRPAWPHRLFFALQTTTRDEVHFEGRTWPLGTAGERAAAYRGLGQELKQLPVEEKDQRLAGLGQELGAPEVSKDSSLAALNWDEVETLRRTGLVEFGSHTHTHPILSRCTVERQEEELRLSRDLIRERLGRADLFAYPNGSRDDFTPDTVGLLHRLGYRGAVTTAPGLNAPGQDLHLLRRVSVGADTTLAQFELGMLGL